MGNKTIDKNLISPKRIITVEDISLPLIKQKEGYKNIIENKKIDKTKLFNHQISLKEEDKLNGKLNIEEVSPKKIKEEEKKILLPEIIKPNNLKQNQLKSGKVERNFEDEMKLKRKQKLIDDRKKIEEERKYQQEKERQKQIVERQKIMDKINLIKKKNNELKEIIKNEKNLNKAEKAINRYERLIQKKYIFFQKEEYPNLIEKFEYIIELEKYLIDEISFDRNNDNYKYFYNYNYNLMSCEDAVYKSNYIIKILGYIGSEISLNNINVYIEKNPTNEIIRDITFKIITSGLATQRIYKLIILGKNKNKFRRNIEEWFEYNNILKKRISESFNISLKDIYFFNYDIEKMTVYFIIYNRKIFGISLLLRNVNLNIIVKPLLKYLILSPNIFEIKYCKSPKDWPDNNLRRGGKRYYPPYDYYGLGLKISEKYKKYGNIWLGEKGNKEGEWAIAYHGVGKGNVFKKVLSIINDNLREGPGQLLKKNNTVINKDKFNTCQEGVYLAPDIDEAERYADKIKLGVFKRNFQFVIMTRVNPKTIRDPAIFPVNWILKGNDEEIRPYRLLVKISRF